MAPCFFKESPCTAVSVCRHKTEPDATGRHLLFAAARLKPERRGVARLPVRQAALLAWVSVHQAGGACSGSKVKGHWNVRVMMP